MSSPMLHQLARCLLTATCERVGVASSGPATPTCCRKASASSCTLRRPRVRFEGEYCTCMFTQNSVAHSSSPPTPPDPLLLLSEVMKSESVL